MAHTSSVYADVLHAGIDLLGDAAVLLACRADERRRTRQAPRRMPLALFGLGILVIGSGLELMWQVVMRETNRADPAPGAFALGLLVFSLAAKEGIARWTLRRARVLGSVTLCASASHIRADALCSLAVLISVFGVAAGWPLLDPIVTVAIALLILKTGIGFVLRAWGSARAARKVLAMSAGRY